MSAMDVDERQSTKRELETEEKDAKKRKEEPAPKGVGVFDTELLRMYYARLFPYEQMFKWLSYGNDPDKVDESGAMVKDYFARRELSFTMENDVYFRYLSFRDCDEMRKEIKKKQPHKIDIGAVYSVPPKNHSTVKSSAFVPLERELVFDIDLTDYDDVRLGCSPDMMWERGSWLYMSVAIRTIDRALREDFGFEHLLWVFSGRRGVHCWVCDPRARQLDDRERTAVVSYLTLITGNDGNRIPLTSPLHPSIKRAMPMLEEIFEKMVLSPDGQDILSTPEKWEKVLSHIPDTSIQERLNDAWKSDSEGTSLKRWKQLRATVLDAAKRQGGPNVFALKKALQSIIIIFTYPRLDVNVSTHRNHLLKSPFVIHPKTGKVCVPILDVDQCDEFNPDSVPNLATLVAELDETAASNQEAVHGNEMDNILRTSMKPYVEEFEKKFLKPLYKSIRQEFQEKAQKKAASIGDW